VHGLEQAIVIRCLQGENAAWEDVVKHYGARIYNLSYRYTRRRDEAEDLTQEIFLRVYQSLPGFRAETGSFKCWLLKVGRNLLIDHYRRTGRARAVNQALEDGEDERFRDQQSPDPLRNVEQGERGRIVRRALSKVPSESRQAIVLHEFHGMDYAEIARVCGVPLGTVKSRVSRGRARLARILSSTVPRRTVH